jgi:IclR family acetate operon transcriptional repressor
VESQPKDMLGKGLWLLTRLGGYPDGVGVSRLADDTGLPVSTTHRLLSTLVDHGFATYEPTSRQYRVGLRVFELSQQLMVSWGHRQVRDVLVRLVNATGESALLGVMEGNELVYVEHVEGTSNPRVKGNVGGRGPLHCTAMGKMLLASMPPADLDHLLDLLRLERYAPKTITSRERLRRELRSIRQRGYATADEEHERDIRSIAVPVRQPSSDRVSAALTLAAPTFRAPPELLLEWLPLLLEASREIALVSRNHER